MCLQGLLLTTIRLSAVQYSSYQYVGHTITKTMLYVTVLAVIVLGEGQLAMVSSCSCGGTCGHHAPVSHIMTLIVPSTYHHILRPCTHLAWHDLFDCMSTVVASNTTAYAYLSWWDGKGDVAGGGGCCRLDC